MRFHPFLTALRLRAQVGTVLAHPYRRSRAYGGLLGLVILVTCAPDISFAYSVRVCVRTPPPASDGVPNVRISLGAKTAVTNRQGCLTDTLTGTNVIAPQLDLFAPSSYAVSGDADLVFEFFSSGYNNPQSITRLIPNIQAQRSRLPVLILVHGIHGTPDDEYLGLPNKYWDGVAGDMQTGFRHLYSSSSLKDLYDLWFFQYYSDRIPARDLAAGLNTWIIARGLQNRRIVFLAHSMGGVVARYYDTLVRNDRNDKAGKKGVFRIITLATPHHGTPAANELARDVLTTDRYPLGSRGWVHALDWLDGAYWLRGGELSNALHPADPNREILRWDNYDGEMEIGAGNDDNQDLRYLNVATRNRGLGKRLIAYGGTISDTDPAYASLRESVDLYPRTCATGPIVDAGCDPEPIVLNFLVFYLHLLGRTQHEKLAFTKLVMGDVLTGVHQINPWHSSDGFVPIQSALIDQVPNVARREFANCDHLEIKDLSRRCTSGGVPIDSVLQSDLLGVLGAGLVATEPLTLTPQQGRVGDMLNGTFAIVNQADIDLTLDAITIGGRDPDGVVSDFPIVENVMIPANGTYRYVGSLTATKAGAYEFFVAYQGPAGWNVNVAGSKGVKTNLKLRIAKSDGAALRISVDRPQGGELWLAGTTQQVRWETTPNDPLAKVMLDYTMDGRTWRTMADALPATGSFDWRIPSTSGARVTVRATVRGTNGVRKSATSGSFTIRDNRRPTINVAVPAATSVKVPIGATPNFQVVASDPDADPLTYQWYLDETLVGGIESALSSSPLSQGIHTIRVDVSDAVFVASRTWTAVVGDSDDDGFAPSADCNDANPAVNPLAPEACDDAIDNNCDGRTDCADPPVPMTVREEVGGN